MRFIRHMLCRLTGGHRYSIKFEKKDGQGRMCGRCWHGHPKL